ncbi:MAG TPA: deoxyguanosinetriphosphate triphosphohydrolase, partial [Hyphomicrobiaceae bacterium]|nr:deoxyguanosinetriphosphate triphosphohydrolase [Hyphomicrobiaceae bacterium]
AVLAHALRGFNSGMDLELASYASGEAQAAAIADDIAWHTHDIDDGLRAGLIETRDLAEVRLVARVLDGMPGGAGCDPTREIYEITRRLITIVIADTVGEARRRMALLSPQHPDDIRAAEGVTVTFSAAMQAELDELRSFLFARLYRHPRVMSVMDGAQAIVRDLVLAYGSGVEAMPEAWQVQANVAEERARLRLVGDFVAGMTDRFAIAEHRRLFDVTPELR